jgi:hypothetical protein
MKGELKATYGGGHYGKGTNRAVSIFWVLEWWGFHDPK